MAANSYTMSDTPRTDAVVGGCATYSSNAAIVEDLIQHARQLERELSEAKAAAAIHENSASHLAQMAVDSLNGPSSEAVAWIITSEKGSVLHFAKADGWKVEVAQTCATGEKA